eukprot:jgi/Picsp_1/3669/NSC_06506-R1_at4g01940 t7b11_20
MSLSGSYVSVTSYRTNDIAIVYKLTDYLCRRRTQQMRGIARPLRTNASASDSESPKDEAVKVTPFAQAQVHRSIGASVTSDDELNTSKGQECSMTVDSVNEALNEVRPFLMADGGDVEVVSVENGRILLQLQGACGSCPASSSTMKMGIERCLQARFGDQIKEVIEVGGGSAVTVTSVESVSAHLNSLRGALDAYGGHVEVVEVNPPHACLRYTGPKPLAYGLVAAIREAFKDLQQIEVYDSKTNDLIEF